MRESKDLEFKETITNSFLKTVSAFANYRDGKIIFGISDNGDIKGISNPVQACLDIENKINDSISPIPSYSLSIDENTQTITLNVKEGFFKPYFYKSKAYQRNDSATIEVDRIELNRLILEGQNMNFEDIPSKAQDLSFSVLEQKLKEILNIKEFSLDVLKTLELYRDSTGYNNAAQLLADNNNFPGIDSVRFGDNINILLDRETFSNESILSQYDNILKKFRTYYEYEEIKGSLRKKTELIPEEAFREAIANALVHRTWDINTHINVAMYNDKIEISSPGGLPKGVSEEIYKNGGISIPRNPIIASIFFQLHLIERFGTGIRRINEAYRENEKKPIYTILNDMIQITLPVLQEQNNLSDDENSVFSALKNSTLSTSDISKATQFSKSKVLSIIKKLVEQGYIEKKGSGRGTKYTAL